MTEANARGNTDPTVSVRRISVLSFVGIVVGYLVVLKLAGFVCEQAVDDENLDRLLTTKVVAWTLVIPIGISFLYAVAATFALGWQRPVLIDHQPVQRWVRVVPALLVVSIVLSTNYGGLADRGLGFTVALLIATQLVGWTEECMFRGIGVTTFRVNGFPERRVALWSSLIFGAVHLSNLIGGNPGALAQAVVVSFAGYFFYLTRRTTGSNVWNSVLHGLFDFSLLSATAIVPEGEAGYAGGAVPILLYIVLAVILLARRHRIEPPAAVAR